MATRGASTSQHLFDSRVGVLLPLPLAGAYDYSVPPGMTLAPGDFVAVPLGNRVVNGVVWGPGTGDIAPEKLKDVMTLLALPRLDHALMKLIEWTAEYTLSAPGAALQKSTSHRL